MFESMKPYNYLESRVANFPKETETTKTIELVDIWGKKHTYAAHYAKKPVNPFDGFGVIRSKLNRDEDYPFLATDIVGLMSNLFTKYINKIITIIPDIDIMPDYVVRSDGPWYAQCRDGHIEEVVPAWKERVRR